MDFNIAYKKLSETERINLTKEVITAISVADNTNNAFISTYLNSAEGRQELLQRITNQKLESPTHTFEEIINTLNQE